MATATPRRSLPSSSQAGKDKDFFLISQARNAHPCITPSPKPTPSIVKSFSLYNRRPSAFQHRQDKKRRFYGPRSISDGTPVRGSAAQKARASTSSSSGSTVPLLPRTHDAPSSRDTQFLDSASLHDNPAAAAPAITVNNRNSAPTTQPAINLSTSSNLTSTTPTTMPPTPTVAPGTHSPSSTLPSIQRTPSRFFVHHPLSTTIDSTTTTTTMPPTSCSSPPSSPPKPATSNNSLSTALHHSPGNISRRNAVHGRGGGGTVPAFATVSSAMLVPEPLRIDVPATRRVRRQGIATPPVSPPPRLRPQLQQLPGSSLSGPPPSSTATTTVSNGNGSSVAFTASTQASPWSSSSAAVSSSGEAAAAAAATEKSQVATPRRLLFPRRAQQQKEGRGGGGGGTYPFSSSSFLARSSMRDGKGGPGGGGKALESGGEGVGVVRRKPVSTNTLMGCAPVREKKAVGEKKKSSASRKGEGSARGESSNMDDGGVGISDDSSYPEELERLEREILSLLFPNPGQQRYSSSSMSSASERKLHELGGAALVISSGSSDEYYDCYDGYMPSSDTTTHPARPNAQNNRSGRPPSGPFPTAPPPLLDPHDEAQMYALMLEEEQSEDGTGHHTTSSLPISDSYTRLNQTGWQSKLARKKSGEQEDENQTLRQIIRQQRHQQHQQQQQQQQQQPPSPVPSPPSPQLLPLPSPVPSPPPMPPPRYRGRNGARQSSGPPPAMRLPDPPVRSPPRLHRSRL
ncbi:hypothetical protein DIS24_g10881 [Lasiodiplodia hormozganensis]|uniref:Uncharacterized protein n=1 Tax=Lasiodiplodia hormozganensis TaxID=869390 RepID=A0AA39X663_9PEZI|nr:hypothetical protein DIS24_g10881 [Lasiodiplodia hormozganensis]